MTSDAAGDRPVGFHVLPDKTTPILLQAQAAAVRVTPEFEVTLADREPHEVAELVGGRGVAWEAEVRVFERTRAVDHLAVRAFEPFPVPCRSEQRLHRAERLELHRVLVERAIEQRQCLLVVVELVAMHDRRRDERGPQPAHGRFR